MAARNTHSTRFQAERSFRGDVYLMFGSKAVILVLGVATAAMMARTLGPDGRGEIAVAVSFVQLLAQLGTLGIASANPYFVAREPSLRAQLAWNSLWLATILGIALAVVGAVIGLLAPTVVSGVGWLELGVALVAIPAILAAQFAHSILLGEGRTKAYNITELGVSAGILVGLTFGLIVLDVGVLGALAILVGGRMVSAAVFLAVVVARNRQPLAMDRSLVRRMMSYGGRIYLATLLAFLLIRIDLLLVNGYLGSTEAGLYSVAVSLADGMYLMPSVVAVNLFARVSRGLGSESSAQAFRTLAVGYGIICLAAIPLSGPGIQFLFGAEFEEAQSLFLWLLPGIFSLGLLNVLAQHFAGRGFPLKAVLVWFAGLGIDIAIILVFLPSNGTYVAAVASSIAYTCLLVLHVRMFAREIGGYKPLVPRYADFKQLWARRTVSQGSSN